MSGLLIPTALGMSPAIRLSAARAPSPGCFGPALDPVM